MASFTGPARYRDGFGEGFEMMRRRWKKRRKEKVNTGERVRKEEEERGEILSPPSLPLSPPPPSFSKTKGLLLGALVLI